MNLTAKLHVPTKSVPPYYDKPPFVLSDGLGHVIGEVPLRGDESEARVIVDLVIEALKDFEPTSSGAEVSGPSFDKVGFDIDDSEWPHVFIYDRADDGLIYCEVYIGEDDLSDRAEQMAFRIMERLDRHLSATPSADMTL